MKLFLDTNVLIAALTDDTAGSDAARALLNANHEFYISVFTLMELRSVLAKKFQFQRSTIESVEQQIRDQTQLTPRGEGIVDDANVLQSQTLLYPMDALMLAAAQWANATLVTFDSELLEHEAVTPVDVL